MNDLKIVLLGDSCVGKSSITVQFVQGKFIKNYDPTIEDSYRKEINIAGKPRMVEILDTGGLEQFSSVRDLYMKNGNGFIVVYSIIDKVSFKEVKGIIEGIRMHKGNTTIPIVVFANKCDLENKRQVGREEAINLAKSQQVHFMEGSALTRTNIVEVFTYIVGEAAKMKKKSRKKSLKIKKKTLCSIQ